MANTEQDHFKPHRRANTRLESQAGLELWKDGQPQTAHLTLMKAKRLQLLHLDGGKILHPNRDLLPKKDDEPIKEHQHDADEHTNAVID